MIFTRIDDAVAVGLGGTLYFGKYQTVDTDDPGFASQVAAAGLDMLNLITLFDADPGWIEGTLEVDGDVEGGTGDGVPPSGDPAGVALPQTE
ncbi:MAG: hypothetical protein V4472_25490 [Pseudomonadota bacterium]